ncbi:MAG: hypothetical protein Q9198_004990 [Flavoplaca austrocitrina]
MATQESFFNGRPNDGGLPEVNHFHGLERHVPLSEQKQLHIPDHEEKEYNWQPNNQPAVDAHGSHSSSNPPPSGPKGQQTQRERGWWKKKRFWIPLALLLLIGAIVAGVVGGLSARRDSSDTASPDSEAATSPSSPGSTSSASVPAQTSPKPLNSSLASVAWSEPGGLGHRRLYYQDDAGIVKESAWNSSGDEWYAANEDLGNAKKNSPIAAAVAGNITWPFVSTPGRSGEHFNVIAGGDIECQARQLNLYYIHPDGHLIERYTMNGQDWESGGLTNDDIVPAPDSDLTTIWSQTDQVSCNECGQQTVIVAYQDSTDQIRVVNVTGSSPRLTTLKADAVQGTGLAFQSVWHREGSPGLRIYYQKGALDLMTIDYEDSEYGAQVTGPLADGAPIASFSTGEDTATGNPLFQYTVSSTSQGINVAWLGDGEYSDTGWHAQTPKVMRNVQPYSAVAANADRHVYAIEDGTVKDFVVSIDGTTWDLVGDVPTVT